jgi:hypothetical protein
MANQLLAINLITREAVRLWRNSNQFIQNIDTQYDDTFAQTGAKIGQSLRIRLPNDFITVTGPAASVQDTSETSTTLVLGTQRHVDVAFSTVDRTMTLDDYSMRVLAPMVNALAGGVAADVMSGADGGVSNFTANLDGNGNVITPDINTWLTAGAILSDNSGPMANRKIIMDPTTQANTVANLSGLLNPQARIGEQYDSGEMYRALGFDWFADQTVLKHTTGSYSGTLTVNGAGQTGTQIVVNAIGGGFAQGDIITFAGVFAVNKITKQTTGTLKQFVITQPVAAGATLINIFPAIIPMVNGLPQQYQTVVASPANAAVIACVTASGTTFRKNLAYVPDAITMATADLELPKGVHEAARDQFDGIAMRMVTAYNVQNDQLITRLDVLYGYLYVRPEWLVSVGNQL